MLQASSHSVFFLLTFKPPAAHAMLAGRKSRYTYMATMASGVSVPSFTGIAKIDLQVRGRGIVWCGLA